MSSTFSNEKHSVLLNSPFTEIIFFLILGLTGTLSRIPSGRDALRPLLGIATLTRIF